MKDRSVAPPVFRVFEHELLRVGDQRGQSTFTGEHLETLADFSRRVRHRYFTLGHRSVRFKNFVGVLTTPRLTVEILPKTDRHRHSPADAWQGILVDLLRACHFVRPESSGTATLEAKPGALLDWYLKVFIEEIMVLLRHGLLHHYQKTEGELGVLRGRLNVSRQLRKNFLHRERFQVTYQEYTRQHPANLMIGAAIHKLLLLPLGGELRGRLQYLSRYFPPAVEKKNYRLPSGPADWQYDRRLDRYRAALTMARHILQNENPDVRSGAYRGLALLFDMNLLFEEYLYRQLLACKGKGVHIERQQSAVFWGQNRLRPDLVIATARDRWVLDTKWRLLPGLQPSAEELRQIYVYCDYFKAKRGVLIFPHAGREPVTYQKHFAPLPAATVQDRSCRLYFARVLSSDGSLNRELGKELLEEIGVVW